MSPGAPHVSVQSALASMSWHLDSLADEVHAIEHAIGDELGSRHSQSTATIARLQRLDFLRQSLEDMAQLTLFLSDQNTDFAADAASARMRLAASKSLLAGLTEKPPSSPRVATSSGEVDLF